MQALLIPGTYLIPGLGQIAITTTLTILLGKTIIETGTEVFNKVKEGLAIHFAKEAKEAADNVPERLKDDEGNVDLGKFDKNVKGKSGKKEEGGWEIEKDHAGHGGSKWKLKNKKGERVASLDENGKILRK
jgi:hypothetical protein